jgi:hypothetical protein
MVWRWFKREFLHLAAGAFLSSAFLWIAFQMCRRAVCDDPEFLVLAVIVGSLPAIREMRDRKKGQSVLKTILDVIAWVSGSVIGAFFMRSTEC